MRRKDSYVLPASPPPFAALIVQYALIAVYALGSSLSGVYTLKLVSGALWGAIWPALVFLAALAALAGVIRTLFTAGSGLEVIGTLALIALLAGYVIAIGYRTSQDGDMGHLPSAVLPMITAVFPGFRLVVAARGVVHR